jgi:tetratricopeptide (TPR) repeat protein
LTSGFCRLENVIALGGKIRLIPARMNQPSTNPPDEAEQISVARAWAERRAWGELLAFAGSWRAAAATSAKAWFFQGVALAGLGRFLEATTAYHRALELDPQDFKSWNNLGQILFEELQRPAEGFACLERMVAIDPQNKLAWSNLASMHGQLGRAAEALACAERALAIDPAMVEAQLHRARAAQLLGRTEVLRAASGALAQVAAENFRRAG